MDRGSPRPDDKGDAVSRRKPLPTDPTPPEAPMPPLDYETPTFEDDPRAVAPDYGKAPARPVIRTTGGVARYG